MSIMIDEPNFKENAFHGMSQKHPVRFTIFSCVIPIKNQNKLVEYLEEKLDICIRVTRKNGIAYFLSSRQSNEKAIQYCFDKYNEIVNQFEIKDFAIDLSVIQGGEPIAAY